MTAKGGPWELEKSRSCPLRAMEASEESSPDLLVASYLCMQPPMVVVSFAREVGGGFISELAQKDFLDRCFHNKVHVEYPPSQAYVRSVVKHMILAAEKEGQEVLEDLYHLHSMYLNSEKSLPLTERCYRTFTFMIPESVKSTLTCTLGSKRTSELIQRRMVTLRVSLNMLDGDTGYYVWPAGLFLAEFLLSHPYLVHGKSCLELGSGTGICGIWLTRLAPSKAMLTDGALSTVANLRHNLAVNGIPVPDGGELSLSQHSRDAAVEVECRQLMWETVSSEELQASAIQVIIGADLIYDPALVPHLVRVLAVALQRKLTSWQGQSNSKDSDGVMTMNHDSEIPAPVAYIAIALRNLTTLHLFFKSAAEVGLVVADITESMMPSTILPEVGLYDRTQVRLYKVVSAINSFVE